MDTLLALFILGTICVALCCIIVGRALRRADYADAVMTRLARYAGRRLS